MDDQKNPLTGVSEPPTPLTSSFPPPPLGNITPPAPPEPLTPPITPPSPPAPLPPLNTPPVPAPEPEVEPPEPPPIVPPTPLTPPSPPPSISEPTPVIPPPVQIPTPVIKADATPPAVPNAAAGDTEGRGAGKYQVRVIASKCIGAASCVAVAPKAFRLNDQQIAEVLATVKEETDENLLLAAQSCPTLAIEVIDTETGEKVWPK
ncbi:hypothetical protein A2W24_00160 [Microgenomates group bacterium RBG_16_45_19]|nr:MAG: hypothetical protein A2W24_00160 [Microgenomates group bacterium RBG_16_45_19]